jgi:hypothetical protein
VQKTIADATNSTEEILGAVFFCLQSRQKKTIKGALAPQSSLPQECAMGFHTTGTVV